MLTSHCHPEHIHSAQCKLREGSHNVKRSFVTDVPQDDVLKGEIISNETINIIFRDLENRLMDKNEIDLNFQHVIFISVYFLERLEEFIEKAKTLNVVVKITNVQPSVYKVFQVGRVKEIINSIVS